MKKKVFATLLAISMIGTLAACGNTNNDAAKTDGGSAKTESSSSGEEKKEITLAWADASNDETMQAVHAAIENVLVPKYEEDYGIKINTLFADSGGDVGQQISDVENFVAQNVDAISIRPVDLDGSVPAYTYATEAGIPVLSTWWKANTEDMVGTLVVVDNTYIGEQMGEWLINYAEENDTTLKVGVLMGTQTNAESNKRSEAFEAKIKEEYGDTTSGKVQIVVSDYGNQDTETSMSLVEDWMQSYPDLNCIFGTNDDSAYGAIQVIKGLGKMDDFTVIGVNGNTYLSLVGDGELDMTVIIDSAAAVNKEMEVLVKAALGEELPDLDAAKADYLKICDSTNFDECWEQYGNK